MLVLTRRPGEVIKIGDDIEIMVVATKGDQVKIGIKAPKTVEILRKEVHDQIINENQLASQDITNILKIFREK
ncbi:carbon storage regulator CsrA [Bacillus sp. 03113]|uniref:carbon storage regulator CsrA n=1 Tax=Bacillus sp. 03113 TaxID=2578211 RepID=UPI001141E0D7|nr:carbon storage regulator CsrA [Bacillus sp. 03113]